MLPREEPQFFGEKIVSIKHYLFLFMQYNIIAKRYPPTHRAAVFEEYTPAAGCNPCGVRARYAVYAGGALPHAAGGASLPRRKFFER